MKHERTRRIGYFILIRIKRASQLSIYSQFVKTARCNQKILGWFYRSRNNVCLGWGLRRYNSFLGLGYCMGCSFESSCGDIDKFGPFNHLKDFSSSLRNSSNLKKYVSPSCYKLHLHCQSQYQRLHFGHQHKVH